MPDDNSDMSTTTAARSTRSSALDHIEIHEDAIHIAQDNQPLTQELESALANLTLHDRKPLREIDMRTLQHTTTAYTQSKSIESTHNLTTTPLSKGAAYSDSLTLSQQSSPRKHQNITSSPLCHDVSTSHKNHRRRKGVDTTLNTMDAGNTLDASSTDESVSRLPAHLAAETSDQPVSTNSQTYTNETSGPEQGQGVRYEGDQVATMLNGVPTPARKMTAVMQSPVDRRTFSNKENWRPDLTPLRTTSTYDILEAAVVEAATPPGSQSRPQSAGRVAFEESQKSSIAKVEKVAQTTTELPIKDEELNSSTQTVVHSPLKVEHVEVEDSKGTATAETFSPAQAGASTSPEPVSSPQSNDTTIIEPCFTPAVLKKKAPIVRTTKAAQARISLAHGQGTPQIPSWGRPRDTSGTPRPSNLRNSLMAARTVSGGSEQSASSASDDEGKKEVVIPHSKPRPMSMIFPTPPPRPQGIKPPTKSTFVLPGEVVAAKLKAAKEEREKKDDSVKTFKARPVPASLRAAPAVRETKTSRARESLGGKDLTDNAHRRAQSVATFRPASQQASRPASRLSRPTSRDSKIGSVHIHETTNTHRSTTSLANISKPRAASPAVTATKPTMSKGREVFKREIFATKAAEEEKRAKEEATKKARAEAAERSRQLSREWAEKKKAQELQMRLAKTLLDQQ